ncbi:MAG: hypothetical protein ACAI44_23105 [Candidatus Sericytochromatia bacterium]
MYEDESFLPLTLSVRGSQPKPLEGLTEAIFDEARVPQRQDLPLDRLLTLLMSTPANEVLAKRLAAEADAWPPPRPVSWISWVPEMGLPELAPTDRRTYRAFDQIVLDGRKSGKYEQAFAELASRHPDIETFAQLQVGYMLNWAVPETTRRFAQELLEKHPGWMMVRLQLARSYLKEQQLDLEDFVAAMGHRLNLYEHLDQLETPLTDLLVYQFHLDLYLFFALKGELKRAAYCFNVCHAAASQPEGLVPLAPLLLASLDPESGAAAFRELVRFLKP